MSLVNIEKSININSFLAYPNLFGIKGFVVVVSIHTSTKVCEMPLNAKPMSYILVNLQTHPYGVNL
jgi:hypothetical protein